MKCNVVKICRARKYNIAEVVGRYESERGVLKDLPPLFFKANWKLLMLCTYDSMV